ncbi:hypothetical protein ES705_14204 [subsurface metagenome]
MGGEKIILYKLANNSLHLTAKTRGVFVSSLRLAAGEF